MMIVTMYVVIALLLMCAGIAIGYWIGSKIGYTAGYGAGHGDYLDNLLKYK